MRALLLGGNSRYGGSNSLDEVFHKELLLKIPDLNPHK